MHKSKIPSLFLLVIGLIVFVKIVIFSDGEYDRDISKYPSKIGTITTIDIISNRTINRNYKEQYREIFSFKMNGESPTYIIDRYENGLGDLIRQLAVGDTVKIWVDSNMSSNYITVVQVHKNGTIVESLANYQKRKANRDGIALLVAIGFIIIGLILSFDINIIKVLTSIVDGKEK